MVQRETDDENDDEFLSYVKNYRLFQEDEQVRKNDEFDPTKLLYCTPFSR